MPDAYLTYKEVSRLVKVSRKTIARWVKEGKFPKPINLNGEPRWVFNEVFVFLARLQIERETKEFDLSAMGQKGTEGDSRGHRGKRGTPPLANPGGEKLG